MRKILIILILSIVTLLLSYKSQRVFAYNTYFYDEFIGPTLDLSKWYPYYNNGTITFIQLSPYTYLQLNANNPSTIFPYIYSVVNPIPLNGDFIINLQIRKNNKHFGTGVSFSRKLPTNGSLAKLTENINDYQDEQFINVVLRDTDLLFVICTECYPNCNKNNVTQINFSKDLLPTNILVKIEYINKKYRIYYNEQIIFNSQVNIDYRPNGIWLGSPSTEGSSQWTILYVDYVKIENPIPPPPLVFLPGYMASFDWEDMVNNTSNNQWQRNPVEKVYDNFWATLKNLGYNDTSAGNLQRWDYDFRRPLPEIAAKFKIWLETYLATQPPSTKVILVGHSFGGLIAHQYLNDNPVNNVDRLITVGSPHEGILDTYPMLAAGETDMKDLGQKAIFETVMRWHGKNFLTKRQTVQSVLPSTQDLIPIFSPPFLKDINGQNINSSVVNSNLLVLKAAPTPLVPIKIVRGTGISTKAYYRLAPRSFLDQILNDWPDGKIENTQYSNFGDNTVLTKSSAITGVESFEISDASHTDIITEPAGIKKILDFAGITYTENQIVDNPVVSAQKALLLLLKSPAEIKVRDLSTNREIGAGASPPFIDNAIAAYNNKFIYIPTGDKKRYNVEVVGTAIGEYQLDIGSLKIGSSSAFLTFNKQTNAAKIDTLQVEYEDTGNLVYMTDVVITNPYDSAKNILSELPQNPLVSDLTADCDLIKRMVETNHDYHNALRQAQKMLRKTFLLQKEIVMSDLTNKIYLRSKILDLIKMEREMFKIINNQNGQYGLIASQNSLISLNQILTVSETKLSQKPTLLDINADSFKKAVQFREEGHRELQANLAGQSYFSSQVARFFASESLK